MSSSPAGTSSNMPGADASVYTPTAQPAADQSLQNLIASFPSATGSPAGTYYGQAGNILSDYILKNPAMDLSLNTANAAQTFDQGIAFPQATGDAYSLSQASGRGLPYGDAALAYGYDPQYNKNITAAENNPFYAPALAGAQQAADIGRGGADQLFTGARQTLDTAFDPQGRLYNRGRADSLDYSAVTSAMAGLGGTPYGASVASSALSNYDLGWQDKQLGRQEKALGVADTTFSDAAKLADTSAAYPSSTYTGNITDISKALGARNTGAAVGGGTYGSILGASGTADTTAAKLDSGALSDYTTYGALPYKTNVGIGKDELAGIDSVTALGNNQYLLPQQGINDLESYLKLGQSSSTISGDLGKTGLSELSSTAGGFGQLASGANSLFGGSSSGGAGLGSIFSGAGGASLDYGGGGAALGVADAAGVAGADAAGGSGGLMALLPMLGSA
jgi:hypothetical protein